MRIIELLLGPGRWVIEHAWPTGEHYIVGMVVAIALAIAVLAWLPSKDVEGAVSPLLSVAFVWPFFWTAAVLALAYSPVIAAFVGIHALGERSRRPAGRGHPKPAPAPDRYAAIAAAEVETLLRGAEGDTPENHSPTPENQ